MSTKAEFKATRERVGMTQAHLAQLMDVSQRSVRYWEDPTQPRRMPPTEAWEIVQDALAQQRRVMGFALAKVDEITQDMGQAPNCIQLPYWKSQADYLTHSTDAASGVVGEYHMANANNLAIAIILEHQGVNVEWVDGNPARPDQSQEAMK